jgi:hypothetical protein
MECADVTCGAMETTGAACGTASGLRDVWQQRDHAEDEER